MLLLCSGKSFDVIQRVLVCMIDQIDSAYRYDIFGKGNESAQAQDSARPTDYGDIDIVAILPILASSFVMLTPLLQWSKLVKEYKFKLVIVLWALLVLGALVPTVVVNFSTVPFYSVDTQLATCQNKVPECSNVHEVSVLYGDPEVAYLDSQNFYEK